MGAPYSLAIPQSAYGRRQAIDQRVSVARANDPQGCLGCRSDNPQLSCVIRASALGQNNDKHEAPVGTFNSVDLEELRGVVKGVVHSAKIMDGVEIKPMLMSILRAGILTHSQPSPSSRQRKVR